MLVISGAAVLPLMAQESSIASAGEERSSADMHLPRLPGRLTFPTVVVKRDPFRVAELANAAARAVSPIAMQTGQADDLGVALPPNAGAGDGTPPTENAAEGGAIIRAVITGKRARALIEIGGVVQVFAVDDRIGDTRITAIDQNGVRLSDGTSMRLSGQR